MSLRVPWAKCGETHISPEEFRQHSREFQHRWGSQLQCPHGHSVYFRDSKEKVCHFVHKSDRCSYGSKYKGGESKEHLDGKLYFEKRLESKELIQFNTLCSKGCGAVLSSERVDPTWTYETEYKLRMGEKNLWADGAFLQGGEVKLVVEVYHTHKVGGEKLHWLRKQSFSFYEVPAQLPPDGIIAILNQSGDLRTCERCKLKERRERERERERERSWREPEKPTHKRKWIPRQVPRQVLPKVEKGSAKRQKARLREDQELARKKLSAHRRRKDQNRPLAMIQREVNRMRLLVRFESLGPTEKARAIVKHRTFISERVNRILWGYSEDYSH